MKQLQGAEKAEYQEIVDQIKREFKNKVQEIINEEKRLMAKDAAELLGREFSDLVKERKQLIEQFTIQSRKVLTFAVQIGLKDKITELSEVIKEKSADAKAKRKSATALFASLLDEVAQCDEELVRQIRLIEGRLAVNNKSMTDLFSSKKAEIEQIEKKYKEKLQKLLVDIVLDFNKRLAVVNKEFGVSSENMVSPVESDSVTEGLKITLNAEDEANGFFIPSDTDEVN